MKIFHYTMHNGCAEDIKNLFQKYNVELTTHIPQNRQHQEYIINKQKSEYLWNIHSEDFLNSDVLIFSDTIPFSRPVLENIDKLSPDVKIILWVTNRFNYAIEGDQSYYDLLNKVKNDPRIFFLYANKFEKVYMHNFVDLSSSNEFFFNPYGIRNKKDFNLENKKDHKNKLFVMSYQNEKQFYPLYEKLNSLGVDFYSKSDWIPQNQYCGPYEIETCSAILHIPYSWGTIALWEYLSIGKTFILPSLEWLNSAYQKYPLFFQTYKSIDAISNFSQWYCEENRNLFIYFDDLSEIPIILNDTNLISDKSLKCFKRVKESNLENHAIIENILNI